MSKLFTKYETILKGGTIKEGEILGLKKILNGYANVSVTEDERKQLLDLVYEHEPRVTKEQAEKGLNWLNNQRRTPRGVERKNNPFGTREEQILDDFDHFTLSGFYDLRMASSFAPELHNYVQCYTVHDNEGYSFEYYVAGGQIEIIG